MPLENHNYVHPLPWHSNLTALSLSGHRLEDKFGWIFLCKITMLCIRGAFFFNTQGTEL